MKTDANKFNIVKYHSQIYKFDSEDTETGLKEFLFSNQNLQCLIILHLKRIPSYI